MNTCEAFRSFDKQEVSGGKMSTDTQTDRAVQI